MELSGLESTDQVALPPIVKCLLIVTEEGTRPMIAVSRDYCFCGELRGRSLERSFSPHALMFDCNLAGQYLIVERTLLICFVSV